MIIWALIILIFSFLKVVIGILIFYPPVLEEAKYRGLSVSDISKISLIMIIDAVVSAFFVFYWIL